MSDKNIDFRSPYDPVEKDLGLFAQGSNRNEQAKQMGRYAETFKPLARNNDPETSKLAADGARATASNHERLILACLSEFGAGTADELAERIGGTLTGVDVARRMGRLASVALVEDSGLHGLSAKGRKATVWELSVGQKQ